MGCSASKTLLKHYSKTSLNKLMKTFLTAYLKQREEDQGRGPAGGGLPPRGGPLRGAPRGAPLIVLLWPSPGRCLALAVSSTISTGILVVSARTTTVIIVVIFLPSSLLLRSAVSPVTITTTVIVVVVVMMMVVAAVT